MKRIARLLADPLWMGALMLTGLVAWVSAAPAESSWWGARSEAHHPASCHGCALAKAQARHR